MYFRCGYLFLCLLVSEQKKRQHPDNHNTCHWPSCVFAMVVVRVLCAVPWLFVLSFFSFLFFVATSFCLFLLQLSLCIGCHSSGGAVVVPAHVIHTPASRVVWGLTMCCSLLFADLDVTLVCVCGEGLHTTHLFSLLCVSPALRCRALHGFLVVCHWLVEATLVVASVSAAVAVPAGCSRLFLLWSGVVPV
jgi:hypothetical protein